MKMLAFDLGASSGKIFLGHFDGSALTLDEVSRFRNEQIAVRDELFWDALEIFRNLREGISASLQAHADIASLGIDSFSNDFGLLDKSGRFITQVHSYRDQRTARNEAQIYSMLSKERLHHLCGNQNALFGTLMQLAAMRLEDQAYLLDGSGTLLLLPDLFNYFLTGEARSEYTVASVSQMMDFSSGDWSQEILDTFGIPRTLMAPIVQPGARIGKISDGWGKSAGGSAPEVVAVCEHDTASAFLSAPLGADAIIISSGTWSLVGVEAAQPVINDYTFQHNIANEGGYPGHHRLLKNVMGLWLIQECRRFYGARGEDYSYEALVEAARQAAPFRFMINPDDVRFFAPGDMPEKIGDFCEENGQGKPEAVGDIIRCVLESLALQYRLVFEELETAAGRRFSQVNIVGGGSNNQLLNQLAANASGKTVLAGPDEATAIGNMLVQLISFGELDSVAQGRSLVRASFSMTEFKAEHTADWDVRYRDYLKMITARRKKNE